MTEKRNWTKELVITQIQSRLDLGLDLNNDAVHHQAPDLYGAGRRLFGSWPKALIAAGLNPEGIKMPRIKRNTWSKSEIVRRIQQYASDGHDLSAHRLYSIDSALVSAGIKYFKEWSYALLAAGFDPEQVRLSSKWDRDRVIEKIRSLHSDNVILSDSNVSMLASDLYGAASTHFGGWRQAIEAAGLDYADIRHTKEWTRSTIIEELQRISSYGLPISGAVSYRGFQSALLREFGSFSAARAAANVKDEEREPVFNCLESIRLKRGLSKSELGRRVNKSHTMIRHYESGTVTPSLHTAIEIAVALEVSVDELFFLDGRSKTLLKANRITPSINEIVDRPPQRIMKLDVYKDLIGRGLGVHDVAKQLGIKEGSVIAYVKKRKAELIDALKNNVNFENIDIKERRSTKDLVLDMCNSLSAKEITEKLGISKQHVYYILSSANRKAVRRYNRSLTEANLEIEGMHLAGPNSEKTTENLDISVKSIEVKTKAYKKLEMYKDFIARGYSVSQIAKELNTRYVYVYRYLKRQGLRAAKAKKSEKTSKHNSLFNQYKHLTENGLTPTQISQSMGKEISTVYQYIKKHGLTLNKDPVVKRSRKAKPINVQVDEIKRDTRNIKKYNQYVALIKKGLTAPQIAKHLGVDKSSVYQYIKANFKNKS